MSDTPRASASGAGAVRWALLVGLVTLVAPCAMLLVTWTVAGRWLYPALMPESFTLAGWRGVVGSSGLVGALLTSGGIALATSTVATALALPVGRSLASLRGWRRHLGAAAAFLPVAAPPLALGTGLQVVALSAGLGGTAVGVLLAHLVPAVGYLSVLFLGVFALYDPRPEEAARTLGATSWQTWWRVTLPMLRQPLVEALAVGFLISWTQVALTLVVGGGAVRTLPLELFAYVRSGQDRAAAVSAVLLIAPAMAALAALRWTARRTALMPV